MGYRVPEGSKMIFDWEHRGKYHLEMIVDMYREYRLMTRNKDEQPSFDEVLMNIVNEDTSLNDPEKILEVSFDQYKRLIERENDYINDLQNYQVTDKTYIETDIINQQYSFYKRTLVLDRHDVDWIVERTGKSVEEVLEYADKLDNTFNLGVKNISMNSIVSSIERATTVRNKRDVTDMLVNFIDAVDMLSQPINK